jgi:cytochrome c peroxidase
MEQVPQGFTLNEWQAVMDVQPLSTPMPKNPANRFADDEKAARLGQMLFMDPEFSAAIRVDGPSGKVGEVGKVACVSCHDPNRSFIDSRTTGAYSHGVAMTTRSSPALVNLGWYEWINWAGRNDSLAAQGAAAPEAGTDVNTSRLFFAHVLYKKYKDEYESVFGELPAALDPMHPEAARFPMAGKPKATMDAPDGPWEKTAPDDRRVINDIMANVGKATEAYERKLVFRNSPFEKFTKGQGDLSPAAKRGLKLFVGKAACNECHRGPIMSDNRFHNIGVSETVAAGGAMDAGRYDEYKRAYNSPWNSFRDYSDDKTHGMRKYAGMDMMSDPPASTKGQFRTPTLHNIADTAPYFHNGSAKSLDEVVHFYNVGGGRAGTFQGVKDPKIAPLGLTAAEEADLVEFLKTLTGTLDTRDWNWGADTSKKL